MLVRVLGGYQGLRVRVLLLSRRPLWPEIHDRALYPHSMPNFRTKELCGSDLRHVDGIGVIIVPGNEVSSAAVTRGFEATCNSFPDKFTLTFR